MFGDRHLGHLAKRGALGAYHDELLDWAVQLYRFFQFFVYHCRARDSLGIKISILKLKSDSTADYCMQVTM